MSIITKGLIGIEDMSLGTSTFNRTTSTGGTNTLTQVDFVRMTSTAAQTITGPILVLSTITSSTYVTRTANPASAGNLRLANTDTIGWRNSANLADDFIQASGAASGNAPADMLATSIFSGINSPMLSAGSTPALNAASGQVRLATGGVISWRNNANGADIPLGKNTSDQLTFNSQVVPSETAVVDLTGQTAAISATTIFTPTATGMFRISAYLKITTTGTSPVLGPVTITYTDGTDSVAQSVVMAQQLQTGAMSTTGNNGNTTTSVLTGSLYIFAKTGVAIQYAVALTGTVGAAQYEVHLKCEAL